jgi:hypothetical protein
MIVKGETSIGAKLRNKELLDEGKPNLFFDPNFLFGRSGDLGLGKYHVILWK